MFESIKKVLSCNYKAVAAKIPGYLQSRKFYFILWAQKHFFSFIIVKSKRNHLAPSF